MATAVLPFRMASQQRFSAKSTLAPPSASSSRNPEASPTTDGLTQPSVGSFGKIRSQLEQTLRSATRSKTKLPSLPAEDFATVSLKTHKGKDRASPNDEVPKEHQEGSRSGVLKRWESKIGFRTRRESITPAQSPIPQPIIGKTKDGGTKSVKIQERERVRSGGLTSFATPSLRQATVSSPALHLSSQAIPSPKSQSAVPASSSSTASILVSPAIDRTDKTRRSSLQQSPTKEISGPIPLSAKREARSNSITNGNDYTNMEPRTIKRPPPLNSPSSPSTLTSSHSQPRTPPRRSHERPRTPESPTPQPSRSRHKKVAASLGNISFDSIVPVTPTPRAGSPTIRAKSPSTRTGVASPSQRGVMSASTSHLPLNPSPTPTASSFGAQHHPSIDTPRCISADVSRRASVDAPRRPSLDIVRRASDSTRASRGVSPSTPVRPSPTTPNQRANSPPYAQNRHFHVSSSSLPPTCIPEQHELIRSATSILCREMCKPPPHLSGSHAGLREWQEVEHRLQHLVRSERIWGKSGLGGTSQFSVSGAAGSNGSSAGGEERERRLFCEALRDGFVLCQLMNKLKPNTIAPVDSREDGFIRTSNITKFLASCSSQGVPSEDIFCRDDLIESTPESLVRVARTVISVVKVVEFPAMDRSKVLTGQNKRPSDNWSGPYGYGTNSRAASSVPNLSQRSASPTTPDSRKRWNPPSPNLPTVRSVSPSERGSGGSSKTNTITSNQNGTLMGDRPQAITPPVLAGAPPALMSRSPLRAQTKSKAAHDVFSQPESLTIPISHMESTLAASLPKAESVAHQSIISSTVTDISAYSSLLDVRRSNNKFGTIRTVTTEATSFAPSDMPSYTRTEASSIVASMSEEINRSMGRERKPSEAAVVDLSRVTEERPEDIASRPGSKAGPLADQGKGKDVISDGKDVTSSPERVLLGKGKWPDDFFDVFQGQSHAQPMLIKSTNGESQDTSLGHNSPTSVSPPRKLAIVGASRLNESLDSIPRRPTHRARHSVETASLVPKKSVFRRETSPDSTPSLEPKVILRRTSTTKRNGVYVPRSSPRASTEFKNGGEPLVPFPRTVSGENGSSSPAPSSNDQPGSDDDKPLQHRGRFHSDIEEMNSRRRARPSSYDELGYKPRRTRFESMANLGVGSSNISASDLIRDSLDGCAVRQTLVVREDGKPPTHFQLGNCIGRGQFGSVYRALNLNTGQMVAVKRIRLEGLKEDEVTQLMREVVLVKSLSHPSIVKYEGMARDEDTLNIVLEYVENGSLGQTLKAFGKLNESLVASYVVKILEGLHYLHQSDVVHCDLKAANILTTKNGNVKLSDFGVSLNLRAMEREMKDVAGTPNWMAPEVIELKGASTKADIWSLGCTVIELLTGRPPYAEIANSMSVMFRIVEDDMPPLPEGASPLLQDFLKVCFNKDPTLRPSAELLCEHEWLKKSWSGLQDLRPQDSIPFLRRVSTDFQKSEALHFLSQIDTSAAQSPSEDDLPRPEVLITGTPPSPISPRKISHDHAPPDDMLPRDHSFVKTTFSKPMVCRVCLLNVKKNAVICESCSLIGHSKCAVNAPPTCDLRAQLLLYAQFAGKGSPGSAYTNLVDPLKVGGHIPTSPVSEVAYVAPSRSSKMSIDVPIVQPPPPHGSPNRPPPAFKFMAAFRPKRFKASLDRELEVQGSSTSLLPAASDIHGQGDVHEHLHDRPGNENALSKKPSVLLKRKPNYMERPQSLSSNGTSPNTASMRSAANSLSSRLEAGKNLAVTDTGRSRPSAGESDVPGRPSQLTSISTASTISTENDDDHPNMIPGSMPPDNLRHNTDSKSGNCAVQ